MAFLPITRVVVTDLHFIIPLAVLLVGICLLVTLH